jgi:hypothetical protein
MKLIQRIATGCVMICSSLAAAESKVLLIGIDGVQFEKLQAASTPNIDQLNISKAFTGGINGSAKDLEWPWMVYHFNRSLGEQASYSRKRGWFS